MKTSVKDFITADVTTIVKKEAVSAGKDICRTVINSIPKRNDIFGPLEFTGKAYSKRIFETSWGEEKPKENNN